MNTLIETLNEGNIDECVIKSAGKLIKNGGIVAFPTETVYGLGANALDKEAVKKIFIAKGRPQDNPLIVHVADFNINHLVKDIPVYAKELMENFWPGPLTLIFNKKSIVPMETSAGLNSIGIRMPRNNIALELIKAAGVPIAAPSANLSGKPSTTNMEVCIEDLKGKVDMIIGGNTSEIGIESTIVDCTIFPPCILRPGAITFEMLKKKVPEIYIDPVIMNEQRKDSKPKAPGMKYKHYAPKAVVKIIEGDLEKTIAKINEIVQNYIDEKLVGEISATESKIKEEISKKIGIMATDETVKFYPQGIVKSLGSRKELTTVAHNLFDILRWMDINEVEIILSEAFAEEGIGLAIMNRLRKSAGYNILKV